MDHLNSLPSTNAAASPASGNARTCGSCSSSHSSESSAPSFADALRDEQPDLRDNEVSQSASSEPAETSDPSSLSALKSLAANDTPEGEQPNAQSLETTVEESYDSVLQLLSELNAATATPIVAAETPLGANNDQSAPTPAGIVATPDISSDMVKPGAAGQISQPVLLAQDNVIQSNANPITSQTQLEGSASVPASTPTNTPILASTNPVAGAGGTAQPDLANNNDPLAAQSQALRGQDNVEPQVPLATNTGTGEDQKSVAATTIGTDGKTLASTPLVNSTTKTAQGAVNESSAAQSVSGSNEGDQAQSASTAKNDTTGSRQGESETRPSSLMQRLKPLDQAAPLFQAQGNVAQDALKAADITAPALTMTSSGEIARPAGISGIVPSLNTPTTPSVPLDNIAVHIAAQARAGNQRFNIRLDPPELGRIDIRLEIGRDGQTLTHIAVDKPETLDLLRQDSRSLERALNSAGLDSREGNLSFSLNEENQDSKQADEEDQDGDALSSDNTLDENEQNGPMTERTLNVASGLDIKI